jgi:hypothetical protein
VILWVEAGYKAGYKRPLVLYYGWAFRQISDQSIVIMIPVMA